MPSAAFLRMQPFTHCWIKALASANEWNQFRLRYSSRTRPLTLSTNPLSPDLLGAPEDKPHTVLAGPLAEGVRDELETALDADRGRICVAQRGEFVEVPRHHRAQGRRLDQRPAQRREDRSKTVRIQNRRPSTR